MRLKIAEDESPEQVEEWGKGFEARCEHYEQVIEILNNAVAAININRESEKAKLMEQEEELKRKCKELIEQLSKWENADEKT